MLCRVWTLSRLTIREECNATFHGLVRQNWMPVAQFHRNAQDIGTSGIVQTGLEELTILRVSHCRCTTTKQRSQIHRFAVPVEDTSVELLGELQQWV